MYNKAIKKCIITKSNIFLCQKILPLKTNLTLKTCKFKFYQSLRDNFCFYTNPKN